MTNRLSILLVFFLYSVAIGIDGISGVPVEPEVELEAGHLKQFEEFMKEHRKKYETPEEKLLRFGHFKNNLKVIEELNAESDGDVEYGVNLFSDLSLEEFKDKYLTYKGQLGAFKPVRAGQSKRTSSALDVEEAAEELQVPATDDPNVIDFDWRTNNKFYPPAEPQGPCGSCYAFAVAGALEIVMSKKLRKVVRYSKQQLVDCDRNDGCEGGYLPEALDYCITPGLALESDYEYRASNETCREKEMKAAIKITSYTREDGEAVISKHLPITPLVISMNSGIKEIQNYKRGVVVPKQNDCSPENLNHSVVLVGHGKIVGQDKKPKNFWVIRNSWDLSYGEEGHLKILCGGACGVGTEVFRFTV